MFVFTARDMGLHPNAFAPFLPVLLVEPLLKLAASEPGRVDGEVRFDRLQGGGTLGNQFLQDRSEIGVVHEFADLHAGDVGGKVSALVRFPEV